MERKYILDHEGNKTAVILAMADYKQLLTDLHELSIIVKRYDEALVNMAEVMQRLEDSGVITAELEDFD